MDKSESYKLGIEAIQKIRTTHNDAINANTNAAVSSVKHFYLHADGALILKCRDALKEYGAKGAIKAFMHLINTVCSITKEGGVKNTVDHEALKLTYESTLDQVELMGLVEWRAVVTGEKDKAPKTEEEKAQEKAEKAKKQATEWLKKQAQLNTAEGAVYAAMLKYGDAFSKAYEANASQAVDQFEGHLRKLNESVGGGVSNRINSLAAA